MGNLTPGWLPRASVGTLLGGGLGLFGLACLGLAVSDVWALTLMIAFLCGLGFGTFQVHYAAMFSRGFGPRSGVVMSLMGVAFGLGGIFGPAVIGVIGASKYAWLLGACGLLSLLIALSFLRMRFEPEPSHPVAPQTQDSSRRLNLALIGFVLLSLTYVAAEVTVGFWGAS